MAEAKTLPARTRHALRWPLLVLVLLAACSRPDAEQRLRSQLQHMQEAAADSRMGDFMDGVSEDFTGNKGADREQLRNLLRLQVLARSHVGVVTGPVDVELQGSRATVRFDALISRGSVRFLPDSAQAYSIISGWREDDGEWKVYYAEWEPRL